MPREHASLERIGWELEEDSGGEEVYLTHADSGTTYVLDSEGGLRVPGDAEVGHDIEILQEALTSALNTGDHNREAMTDGGQTGSCNIECDESTGEVTIESDTDISLDSGGTITLDATAIELSTDGNTTIDASGLLTLEGSLIKLN